MGSCKWGVCRVPLRVLWCSIGFGGSYKWGHISRVTILITHIRGVITELLATQEPPISPTL